MDLANTRRQGMHHLIAYCLNDASRHQAVIDVSERRQALTLTTVFAIRIRTCIEGQL